MLPRSLAGSALMVAVRPLDQPHVNPSNLGSQTLLVDRTKTVARKWRPNAIHVELLFLFIEYPTELFAILEPQSPLIDSSLTT